MPPILMQTLYIDMHTVGLETAIAQIVGVSQGNASFTPQHPGFSNLSYFVTSDAQGAIDITVKASHLMEPNPNFMMVVENPESEVAWTCPGAPGFYGGFAAHVAVVEGRALNAITMRPMNATLTPAYPVRLQLTQTGVARIVLRGVLHQISEKQWVDVPLAG